MIDKLHIFIDETGNSNFSKGSSSFSLGAFVSLTNNYEYLIQKAINNVKEKNFDDGHEPDRLLRHCYFHASADTTLARNSICNEIAKIDYPFEYYIFNIKKTLNISTNEKIFNDLNTESLIHHLLIELISTNFIQSKINEINIYLSERQPSLKEYHKDELYRNIIKSLSYSAIKTPILPILLPNIKIIITKKQLPGLQISDFILWALQYKDQSFTAKLGLQPHAGMSGEDNPFSYNLYFKNSLIIKEFLLPIEMIPPLKVLNDMFSNQNNIFNGIINIQKIILDLTDKYQNIKNTITQERVIRIINIINTNDFLSSDVIIEICILFLLLADEIPFYNTNKTEEIEIIYFYKFICSIISDKSNFTGTRIRNIWNKIQEGN